MRVTPLDIRKQEFRKSMRGLDADEVYAFLNTVADEYEVVLSDNKKLRERIVELEERLKEYKNIETNLRNTLLTAERLTAEAKENAKREASLIIREAEMEAEKAAEAIRAQTQQLRREILELKKHKDNYVARLKTWLESHRKMIDGFEEDFSTVDEDIEKIGRKVEKDVVKVKQTRRMNRERITEDFSREAEGKATWNEERRRDEEKRPTVPRPEWHRKPAQQFEDGSKGHGGGSVESMNFPSSAPGAGEGASAKGPVASDAPDVPHIKTEPIGAVVDEVKPPRKGAVSGESLAGNDVESWEEKKLKEDVARSIEQKLYPEPGVGEAGGGSMDGLPHGEVSRRAAEGSDVKEQEGIRQDEQRVDSPDNETGVSGGMTEDRWKQYDVREEEPDWKSYEVPVDKAGVGGGPAEGPGMDGRFSPEEAASPGGEIAGPGDSSVPDESEVEEALSGLTEAVEGDESTWSMEELKKNLSNLNPDERD